MTALSSMALKCGALSKLSNAGRACVVRFFSLTVRILPVAVLSWALPVTTLSNSPGSLATVAEGAEAGLLTASGVVSTPAQLTRALAIARDGERIVLAAGRYGVLSIKDRRFVKGVTVTSANPRSPAIFSSIRIVGVQGLSLQDIRVEFTPDAKTVQSDSAVFVKDSSAVSLARNKLVGGLAVSGVPESTAAGQLDRTGNVLGRPTARAVTISTSQDVNIVDNDVSVFHMGVVLDRVTGAVLARNVIHDLRTTPLAGRQVSHIRIEGNHFHSFRPWKFGGAGDHGDLIHLYTTPGAAPSRDIIIRANWLEQGGGDPLLGIYMDDNKLGIGFLNVLIEHNLILNGDHQGVRLENVQGVVRNNTLVLTRGAEPKRAPQILAIQNSNVLVTKNVVSNIAVYPGSVVNDQDNLIISMRGHGKGNPYDRVFVNAAASDPTPRLFSLRQSARASLMGADMSLIEAQMAARPATATPRSN